MGQRCVYRIVVVGAIVALLSACDMISSGGLSEKPPQPPSNVTVSFVQNGLKIEWEPVEGADYYTVFWGVEKDHYRDLADVKGTSVVLTGLKPGNSYSYSVSAWNERGESDFSDGGIIVYDDDPARARTYVSRANDLLQKGRYEDARTYYTTAISLNPDDPLAYERRAKLHELTERKELARRDYAMAQKVKRERQKD